MSLLCTKLDIQLCFVLYCVLFKIVYDSTQFWVKDCEEMITYLIFIVLFLCKALIPLGSNINGHIC